MKQSDHTYKWNTKGKYRNTVILYGITEFRPSAPEMSLNKQTDKLKNCFYIV